MAGGDLLVSSWDGHAELKAPCFKTRTVPAGPERLLCSGSLPHLPQQPVQAQQAPAKQRSQRVQGNLGILHGGHPVPVTTWLCSCSLLRPSGSSFPALPGPWRPLGVQPAAAQSASRSRGLQEAGVVLELHRAGSCACTESALSPLCLSAPGRLAQEAAPTTAQGLEPGTCSDRLHSC